MSKKLSRRFFLRGAAGTTLLLPQLEYFFRSDTAFAQEASKPNFIAVFLANGMHGGYWECSGTETNWTLSEDLSPLAANKENITVIHGLFNQAAEDANSLNLNISHWTSATTFLTGSHYDFNADFNNVTRLDKNLASIDQRIAAADNSPLPSLVMGLQATGQQDWMPRGDDRGIVAYLNRISWTDQNTQTPRSYTSAQVFRDIFGVDPVPGGTGPVEITLPPERLGSVLDSVMAQRDRFVSRLGGEDKARMEKYFDSMRELEQSIAQEERLRQISCDSPTGEFETSEAMSLINQRASNMAHLAATALSCGITRVVTHMLGNEHNNGPSEDMIGLTHNGESIQHHSASHYNQPESGGRLDITRGFVTWQVGMFNTFLNELKNGQVLDNSIVLFGSGMGDGNYHSRDNLPIVVAGSGGGLRPGRMIRANDDLADLLFSLLVKAGVQASDHAGSSKMLNYL